MSVRVQLNLCSTTTLVEFVANEIAFPGDAELNPELHAPSEDRNRPPLDASVGIKNRAFQLVVAEGALHPKPLDDEDLGDRPDLFDRRQVGGIRRPPVQEPDVHRLEPSSCRGRRVATSAVLLENRVGSASLHELRNAVTAKHLDVRPRVLRFRAQNQISLLVANDAAPNLMERNFTVVKCTALPFLIHHTMERSGEVAKRDSSVN